MGELLITDDLTITGLGADQLTISGNNASRIFAVNDDDVATAITVEISGLTLADGYSFEYGGAIYSQETLTVEGCTVTGNSGLLRAAAVLPTTAR